MTNRDIHFFILVFASGFISLLFVENAYTYPHKEFEFPKSFENSESNDDRSMQPAVQTTAATTYARENQVSISNTNHMNVRDTSLRSQISQDDISSLNDRTYQTDELFDIHKWPENTNNNNNNNNEGWNSNVQNDTYQYHDSDNRNVSLISSNLTQAQIGQRRLQQQQHNVVSSTTQVDAKFVFPMEDIPTSKPHRSPIGPAPSCHGSTFCESVSYYPEEIVNYAIQQNDSIKYLATVDVLPNVVERIDASDDTPLCVSNEQVIYPKTAESKNKEWLFVVNQENFKQGVRIETCGNENHDCSIGDCLPDGYKTVCKQKYIYRQLATVTDSGTLNSEMFRFPSSCCCHLKFTGNALTRMGLTGNQRSQTTPIKNHNK